ncbi:Adenine-specific methyltransferase EcoRI [Xylanibacter ruminicola]|uniref:Adenine-specific methyltransferase EcoRI n=1 Tax=Xylanibacter ruminicola TaxID=839 RepID=A0A1M7CNE7_XYLRU|nr:adenine-specific methyltransferase EcoRI family protein [Xylanibacter ruminicola]SHL68712.1 Adenine-specific methyltransferase EcoRI [Xylanibacter ruminicola]
MANTNLSNAKSAKNDEFYTQYSDIQKEINAYLEYDPDVFRGKTVLLPCDDPEWSNFTKFFAQNFETYGLKKLISTSYAVESKKIKEWEPTLFETESPYYDADKSRTNGKIFVLDEDINGDGRFNINDLQWSYLKGDGDFRSDEVKALRDEADIIITNPPFSLFREFFMWIMEAGKKFVVICNKNCVSYKEVFPYIKNNQVWVGSTPMSQDLLFEVPKSMEEEFIKNGKAGSNYRIVDGKVFGRSTSIWITNIDHGRRHEPLPLMTMEDNIMYSKHKEIRGKKYAHYENFDAIDVPFYDAIPSDYDGLMGVPRSFLDKFCPDQFEIIGNAEGDAGKELGFKPYPRELRKLNKSLRDGQPYYYDEDGYPQKPFGRIIIRKKQ